MEKRAGISILISLILISSIILLMPGAVAQDIGGDIETAIEEIKDVGRPILEALVGSVGTGEALFSKFLLFILVAAVVYAVLSSVGFFTERPGILVLVSIIVSILGVRFLVTEAIINAILLPYGSFFITISVGIPFVLFFWILENNFRENPAIRKIGWAVFIAAFGVLGWMRADEIGNGAFIYIAAIVLATLAFWFDGTIQRLWHGAIIERKTASVQNVEIERALARLSDLQQQLGRATTAKDQARLRGLITKQKNALNALRKSS